MSGSYKEISHHKDPLSGFDRADQGLQSTTGYASIVFLSISSDGRITRAHAGVEKMLGAENGSLIDSDFSGFLEQGSRPIFRSWLASKKGDPIAHINLRLQDGTSTGRLIRLVAAPEEANPDSADMLCVMMDLSEKEHLELNVREANNRLRTVYKCIPVSTITWQWQTGVFRLVDYNNVAEDITAGKIRELVGSAASQFYYDRPDIVADLNLCLEKRQDLKRQWPYTFRTTGQEAYFIATFAYVAPDSILLHTQDITKRKKAEEELYAYQQQLLTLALELSKTEERERRRIASDLHDGVGQYLALSRLKLSKLKKKSSRDQVRILEEVIELISRATEDARTLTVELSPPALYELGLQSALEWLAECSEQSHGLKTCFRATGRPSHLSEELRGFLYRAAAELAANAVKHSEADRVDISLDWLPDSLNLSVADNGQGFDYPETTATAPKGFGLFSIRERLRPLGGRMEVIATPGRGAKISLILPLSHGHGVD